MSVCYTTIFTLSDCWYVVFWLRRSQKPTCQQSQSVQIYSLDNCFCKMLDFTSSLNLRKSLSFTPATNGDTFSPQLPSGGCPKCLWVPFRLQRYSFSNSFFALCRNDLALLLAFVYFCRDAYHYQGVFSSMPRYALVSLRITSRSVCINWKTTFGFPGRFF